MGIPWFAPQFSPLPSGYVAFCSDMSPGSVVTLEAGRHERLLDFAERLLDDFKERRTQASAFIPPNLLSPGFIVRQIPAQVAAYVTTFKRRRKRAWLRYTETPGSHSIASRVREGIRVRRNLLRLRNRKLVAEPPLDTGFAFFGLHMQPEASVDVWAPFFSNQIRVVELLSRSLPPTHKLLVKLHKSDVPNYSPEYIAALEKFPGVEVVSPYADTHRFILRADLVFTIQGTMGLEAALLGKPVMVGKSIDLPGLVRAKLKSSPPSRAEVIGAFARHLAPYYPASSNDWTYVPDGKAIDGYSSLFDLLGNYLRD
jgi:hypothetical protein